MNAIWWSACRALAAASADVAGVVTGGGGGGGGGGGSIFAATAAVPVSLPTSCSIAEVSSSSEHPVFTRAAFSAVAVRRSCSVAVTMHLPPSFISFDDSVFSAASSLPSSI